MNNEVEALKNFFSNSAEYVFILNRDLDILWQNKDNCPLALDRESLAELSENDSEALESGDYILTRNELEYPIKLINYKELGIYVVQLSGEDVFASALGHSSVRHFLANQEAQIRESVVGITFAGDMLRSMLDEKGLKEGEHFANIATGNCYKLLRSVVGSSELMKYNENCISPVSIALVSMLRGFITACERVVGKGIKFIFQSAIDEVYIKADTERLKTCLLELILLTCRNNKHTKTITISVTKSGDSISLTLFAGNAKKEPVRSVFSKLEKLYTDECSDPDLIVVSRFCSHFGAGLYIAEIPETNGKSYSLRMSECYDLDGELLFCSPMESLGEDRFSIYNIMLSELSEYE